MVQAEPPANTPRTQIETAIGLQPTFLSIWLGSNDALGAALAATVDDTTLTPVADFRTDADTAFGALAATGAEAVVFNVPDVTVIANLFSVSELSALTGLDAASARQVKAILAGRVAAGASIILTTHILEVAERLADRIGIICRGRLVAEGTLDELRASNRPSADAHHSTLEELFLALTEPDQRREGEAA